MTSQPDLFASDAPTQLYLFDTIPGIGPGPMPSPIPGSFPGLEPDCEPDYDPDPVLPPGPEAPYPDPGFPGNIFPDPAPVT
jgi:hypothetical protein